MYSFLVAWLTARSQGLSVVLRIDDLDRERCKPEYAAQLMRDLEWLGITWDEGPFYEHDRTEAYRAAFEVLQDKGLVYPCFCTRADLRAASAPHAGETRVYQGTCRTLTIDERNELMQSRTPSWRVFIGDGTYGFSDMFQGNQKYDLQRDCGDVVVRRSDGLFAYQLAVVVDDADEGVTQVVRGHDLMSSVPVQAAMAEALGLPVPEYGHVPLLVGPDGRRLAKRDRDIHIGMLKERYKAPERVLGLVCEKTGLVPPHVLSNASIALDELLVAWDTKSCCRPSIAIE